MILSLDLMDDSLYIKSQGIDALKQILSDMLHNHSDKLPTLDLGEQHLRNGLFIENAVLLTLHRQADVYTTTFCRRNLGVKAVFTEVYLPRISRIELNRRCGTGDLKRE